MKTSSGLPTDVAPSQTLTCKVKSQPLIEAYTTYQNTKFFGSLDGVRCVSILAVIWHHSPHPASLPQIFSRGFLGVDMFFVLSGFLIVTLLLREKARTGSIDIRKFYIRRSIRIMPVYYLLLGAVALMMLTVKSGSSTAANFWHDLPYLATYTSNWVDITAINLALVWSLATEEQFYLIWPSVERYLKPCTIMILLATVLIVNQLLNFGFFDALLQNVYGRIQHRPNILSVTFTPIALGVLLAHALHRSRSFAALYPILGGRLTPWVCGGGLMLLCFWSPGDMSGLPRVSIQLLMTALLASLVIREDHWARPILTFGPISRLGVISYGMYLYHEWVMHPLQGQVRVKLSAFPGSFFVISVVLTVIVAELSFRIVETPLLRWKTRFAR